MNGEFPNRRFINRRKVFFLPMFLLFVLLLSAIVYWLWNLLLPEILGVKQITYWQALGLLVLCRILFGHFGWRKNGDYKRWGQDFREKFRHMSEEDKNRFREEWKRRCRK